MGHQVGHIVNRERTSANAHLPKASRWVILAALSGLSTLYVFFHVIRPFVNLRMELADAILSGTAEPPYRYRVLKHWLASLLEFPLSWLLDDGTVVHQLAYGTLVLATLLAINVLLYRELSARFGDSWALFGTAWMQLLVPLSVTGAMMEGDFLTLLAYVGGLALMRTGRDHYVPLVILVTALNREQAIFIAGLHGLYLLDGKHRGPLQAVGLFAADVIAWAVSFVGLRWVYGVLPSRFTLRGHVTYNTDPGNLVMDILPRLAVVIGPLLILACLGRRKASSFERLTMMALVPYTVLFFLLGKMDELAKFLPAALILLPVALLGLGAKEVGSGTADGAYDGIDVRVGDRRVDR